MKGGLIKISNKRFTTIQNDYCITFDKSSEIVEVQDDSEDIQMSFNFTSLT